MRQAKNILLFITLVLFCFFFLGDSTFANEFSQNDDEADQFFELPERTIIDTTVFAFDTSPGEDPPYFYNQRAAYFSHVSAYAHTYRGSYAHFANDNDFTKQRVINLLQNSIVFFAHTHGSEDSIQISLTSPSYLYTSDLNNVSLTYLYCVVLLSCKGGKTINGYTDNMIQTLVNRGTTCAVGFNNDITTSDANSFAIQFAGMTMQYANTVAYAINNMDVSQMTNDMSQLAVIEGNSSITLQPTGWE